MFQNDEKIEQLQNLLGLNLIQNLLGHLITSASNIFELNKYIVYQYMSLRMKIEFYNCEKNLFR